MTAAGTPQAAIVYARLSDTLDDAAGALSLADQDAKARARAAHLGWTVARTVTENDMTGSGRRSNASAYKTVMVTQPDGKVTFEDRRPRWREVLVDLATGAADGLIVLDLDRALRQMRTAQDLIDVNRATGVPVESATGSLRCYGEQDYDQLTIVAWAAWKSSKDTARRVKAARERQARAGTWSGGPRPYGWQPTDKPGQLAVVEHERETVRHLAGGVIAGRSLHALARELNERGVTSAQGGTWSIDTVRQTLLRERNTGRIEGKPATWAPLLDASTWDQCREILTNPARRTSPGNKSKHLGSGIYRCAVCRGPLYSRHDSYYCQQGCVKILRANTDTEVVARVVLRLAQPDAAELLAPSGDDGKGLADLTRQAASLRQRKDMLAGMFAAGELDAGEWKSASSVVKDKLRALDAKLARAAEHTKQAPAAAIAGREDAESVWAGLDLEGQRAVLRSLVTVTVSRQGKGKRRPGWKRGDSYAWFNPGRISVSFGQQAAEAAA